MYLSHVSISQFFLLKEPKSSDIPRFGFWVPGGRHTGVHVSILSTFTRSFLGILYSPGAAEQLRTQAESHSLWLQEPENRGWTCQSSYELRGEILKNHRGRALKSASENPPTLWQTLNYTGKTPRGPENSSIGRLKEMVLQLLLMRTVELAAHRLVSLSALRDHPNSRVASSRVRLCPHTDPSPSKIPARRTYCLFWPPDK